LYLFPALIRLDRQNGRGSVGMWSLAILGLAATTVAVGLAFVPPRGATHWMNYVLNLVLQTGAVMGLGVALVAVSRRRGDAADPRAAPRSS
jgi:hypothetical protein